MQMKLESIAQNATLLLTSYFGFWNWVVKDDSRAQSLQSQGLDITETMLRIGHNMAAVDQYYRLILNSVRGNGFREAKRQFSYFYSLPNIGHRPQSQQQNGNDRNHNQSHFRHHIKIPVYALPTLTSLMFYSSNSRESSPANNFQNSGTPSCSVSTGAFCIAKTNPKDYIPAESVECSPMGCGEDSFAVELGDGYVLLAVADGVGGWRKKGVDPAVFAQTLMEHTAAIFLENNHESQAKDLDYPRTLLREAFWRLVEDHVKGRLQPFGSSTACIVLVDIMTSSVRFANLGDSGFLILTPDSNFKFNEDGSIPSPVQYRVKFKSSSQQFRFNAPYQITLRPPQGIAQDTSGLAATELTSLPAEDRLRQLTVEPGDLIFVMSDGVLDNVFTDEMISIVNENLPLLSSKQSLKQIPRLLARQIALRARKESQDELRESPFSLEARKSNLTYLGGKEDDITVVAALIH